MLRQYNDEILAERYSLNSLLDDLDIDEDD
jgi:hypothetical protein